MQPEIHYGKYYLVDTPDGTELIPDLLVNIPDQNLTEPRIIDVDEELAEELLPYIRADKIDSVVVNEGWYGRYSMPGYLDATDWHWSETEENLLVKLDRMYGDAEYG